MVFAIVTTPETQEDDIERSWELVEGSQELLNSTDGSCVVFNAIQIGRKNERDVIKELLTAQLMLWQAQARHRTNTGDLDNAGKFQAKAEGLTDVIELLEHPLPRG